MNESAPLRFGLPKFDPHDDQQIDAAIDDELTFHIEQMTREFVEAGQSVDDAKVNALARFGDVQQIKAQCKCIALEERIMLQRINLVLMIVVLLAVAFVSVQMYVTQEHNRLALQTIVTDIADMKVAAAQASRDGKVTILGAVSRPGIYPIPRTGDYTLANLLVDAGPQDRAFKVQLLRRGNGEHTTFAEETISMLHEMDRLQEQIVDGDRVVVEPVLSYRPARSTSNMGFVYVEGSIPRPGIYSLQAGGNMTLSVLIDGAGGLKQTPVQVQVTRLDETGNLEIIVDSLISEVSDLRRNNVLLHPDDHVIVTTIDEDIADTKVPTNGTSSRLVYLDGDVQRPGVYALPRVGRLTLSRLVAAAGGSQTDAYHLRVIRTVGNTPKKVFDRLVDDLGDLAENDLDLRSDDFVVVAATKAVPTKSDE